jgi:catechol 2,3-dioxygenase-like lactoylglutathione lyase family enzyme
MAQSWFKEGKMRRLLGSSASCAAVVLCFTLPAAAGSAEVAVIGSENLIHTVADTNKTYAFYRALGVDIADRDVLGGVQPKGVVPPPKESSESLDKLCDTPHTTWRYLALTIPNGFNMELIEFTGLERKRTRPGNQDPGATTLVLTVRDVDAALAAAKNAGASVVTAGGAPLSIGAGKSRSVVIRDPDGFFVELLQPDPLPQTTAPGTSNVIGGSLKRTIQDKTLQFYRDVFGFDIQPEASFTGNKITANLVGVPEKAQFRSSMASIPGSPVHWEFIEFKDLHGKPFHPKISEPGAPGFQLKVRDVDAAVKAVKAAGGTILTTGGEPLIIGNNRTVLAHDPDGFLLELMQKLAH